jgi:hypothetical protein
MATKIEYALLDLRNMDSEELYKELEEFGEENYSVICKVNLTNGARLILSRSVESENDDIPRSI